MPKRAERRHRLAVEKARWRDRVKVWQRRAYAPWKPSLEIYERLALKRAATPAPCSCPTCRGTRYRTAPRTKRWSSEEP